MIRILIKKPDWNYEEPNYFLNFEKLFKLFNTSSEQTEDGNVTPGKKWPKIARIS